MEDRDEELRPDEDDQRVRSTKKFKMNNSVFANEGNENKGDNQASNIELDSHGNEDTVVPPSANLTSSQMSYKNMLLGVNGMSNDLSSEEVEDWQEEYGYEDDMQDQESEQSDPLCPSIHITAEERENLCRPWRKALIIKLLGRRIGYRILYGRIQKLWNLAGTFELIDL